MSRPVVIGLTGGVASGKSTVANMFQRLGASVLDGDQVGHEVLNDPDVLSQIQAIWGEDVLEDGVVNRKALGNIVFGAPDRKQLSALEQITHPIIRQRILEELRLATLRKTIAVVLDAPLLFEAGWDQLCDKLVFVKSSLAVRTERAKTRGWTDQELKRREDRQMDLQHKEENSTDFIDNSSSQENTLDQVKKLWTSWGLMIVEQSEN